MLQSSEQFTRLSQHLSRIAIPASLSKHRKKLSIKADLSMVQLLVSDVLLDAVDARLAHGKAAVSLLPSEITQLRMDLVNPL